MNASRCLRRVFDIRAIHLLVTLAIALTVMVLPERSWAASIVSPPGCQATDPKEFIAHVPGMKDARDKLARLTIEMQDVTLEPKLHVEISMHATLSNGATSLLSDLATGVDILDAISHIPGLPKVPVDDIIRTLVQDQARKHCAPGLRKFLDDDLADFVPKVPVGDKNYSLYEMIRGALKQYAATKVNADSICSYLIDELYVDLASLGANKYKSGRSCAGTKLSIVIDDLNAPPKLSGPHMFTRLDSEPTYPGCIADQITFDLPQLCTPETCLLPPHPGCSLCVSCAPKLCTPDAIHFGRNGGFIGPIYTPACKWTLPENAPDPPRPNKVEQPPKPRVNQAPIVQSYAPGDGSIVPTNTPTLSVVAQDPEGDPLEYQFTLVGNQVNISRPWGPSASWAIPPFTLDPAERYTWSFQVRDIYGQGKRHELAPWTLEFEVQWMPVAASLVTTPNGRGYWTVDTKGKVRNFGSAKYYGSLPDQNIHVQNIVGMARTVDGGGYWLVGSDGGVFSFGNAKFYGSMGGKPLNKPVIAMSPRHDGKGYWLVAKDGGVFSFGSAKFHGSMGGQHLNAPVVGMGVTPDSAGYWLAAEDGGVFSFGNAKFHGSMGGQRLNAPVSGMAAHPKGKGYWLVAEDGGVFTFGKGIGFYGSMAGHRLNGHIVGMNPTPSGRGYYLLGCDGGIFTFGNAIFRGSNPSFACRGYPVP